MAKYIGKRILHAIPLILVITILCFVLIQFAPYNAVDAMTSPKMSKATVALLKKRYGYNRPLYVQYLRWLQGLCTGHFGYSILTHASIANSLKARIPATIQLVLPAYIAALLLSVFLGMWAGMRRNHLADKIIDGLCSVGIAIPTFWFAMLVIYLFGYRLNLFPLMGMHEVGLEGSLPDYLRHYAMPFLVLTVSFFPGFTRYIRASTIREMREEYVTVQRSFGRTKWQILRRHVSKNVLLPIVTMIGMDLPMLVTGAAITETIFAWPGVGSYYVKAIRAMDYPIVMAILVLSSVFVIGGNLLADIVCCLIDPRMKRAGA